MDNVKEPVMKTSTFFLVGLSALYLMGCQGQNPFRRQSDPTSQYTVKENSRPYRTNESKEPATPPPDTRERVCPESFRISVEGSHGSRTLYFVEGESKTYNINVRNLLGDKFSLSTPKIPQGASFAAIDAAAGKFRFTWTPGRVGNMSHRQESLVLQFTSPAYQTACPVNSAAVEQLDVVVQMSNDEPSLEITGLTKNVLPFGEDIEFQVRIKDPNGSANYVPNLINGFMRADARNSERVILNARSAIDCESIGVWQNNEYLVKCKFISKLLPNLETLLNSGNTATARFFMQASSSRTRLSSPEVQSDIQVKFPKTTTGAASESVDDSRPTFAPPVEQQQPRTATPDTRAPRAGRPQ